MQTFIPFDFTDKATLIAYFNDEQLDELRNFALAFFQIPAERLLQVTLLDIGYTGLLLNIIQPTTVTSHFLPFAEPISQRDDLQPQYIVLIQQAAKILGKASIELRKRTFILLDKYAITPNMARLVLQSEQDLSHLPAGYAFLFNTPSLKHDHPRPVRYYTLRKAWQSLSETGQRQNLAWVDIYCHGEKNGEISLGETWVNALTVGDKITSEREFPEKIDHLTFNKPQAQSLLIADETSLPTVARLLETWENPKSPIIITFLQTAHEERYLEAIFQNASTTILPVIAADNVSPQAQIFTTLHQFLQHTPTHIDSVWGGLEATTTKQLRPLLCNLLNLTREKMVLKVYWRET